MEFLFKAGYQYEEHHPLMEVWCWMEFYLSAGSDWQMTGLLFFNSEESVSRPSQSGRLSWASQNPMSRQSQYCCVALTTIVSCSHEMMGTSPTT